MKIKEINLISDWGFEDNISRPQSKEAYELDKNKIRKIFRLGEIEAWSKEWPTKDYTRFYFLDLWGNLKGYTSLMYQGHPRSQTYFQNTVKIKMIWIEPEFRGKGLISKFYRKILDSGYSILSDQDQTLQSKNLWKGLMKTHQLYLVDGDKTTKVVNDEDFERVYGRSRAKYSSLLLAK